MKSIIQEDRTKCFLCGRNGNGDYLEEHHIFFGYNRKKSDKYGLTVYLCGNACHRNGENSVHKNARVCRKLQAHAQEIAMEKYNLSTTEWIRLFGKNYIRED